MDNRNNPYGATGYNDARNQGDYGQDFGSHRDYTYSSARDYAAAGELGRGRREGRSSWDRDRNDWRSEGYEFRREEGDSRRDRDRDWNDYGPHSYGNQGSHGQDRRYDYGAGSTGRDWSDRNRFAGRYGPPPQGRFGDGMSPGTQRRYDDERELRGYDRDRGFFDRAGDEVRSWFGDEEAERRRRQDQRYDEIQARNEGAHDPHYGEWRRSRIAEFDRDYDEYRRENAQRFHSEFENWRTERTSQRDSLRRVTEHMEVLGSDGSHVGTVDKVRGDRIILTKNDTDAEGRHHSIPSRWIQAVDEKVTLRKTAEEAKNHWRDEEQSGAMFGADRGKSTSTTTDQTSTADRSQDWSTTGNLNSSFKGTY